MTTGRLPTKHWWTDHSKQSTQFAIGIVIAVVAVLGIDYALQQFTQTPLPASGSVSSIDPAPQSEERAARHSDLPGYATVQDAQSLEQPSVLLADAPPNSGIHYFPVQSEVTTDSQVVEPVQLGLLVQESAPADQPDSYEPFSPVPARLAAPVPGRANPIRPGTNHHQKQLRSIIRQELPLASEDEQEIWLNALRGLAPHTVRQLLRLRQTIREEPPSITSGTSRRPVSTRAIGPTRSKTIFSGTSSTPGPLTRPLLIGRTSTVGRGKLAAHLVPERLRLAVEAISLARDAILNNIVNANTIGFKRRRVFFENLVGARERGHETVRLGVQVSEIQSDHSPGPLRTTRGPLDLAIDGDGFFQIQDGPEILYTRAGNFSVNADGELIIRSADHARLLEPAITIPQDAIRIVISHDGTVSVQQPLVSDLTQVGQIQTARFINPQGLLQQGENLYKITGASGQSYLGNPGSEGRGKLRQFCLEQSNVRLKDELRSLTRLQQQLLAIRQAARILSEFGEFNSPPTHSSPNPGPLVREPVPPTGPDGPKLSRQPAPQKQ